MEPFKSFEEFDEVAKILKSLYRSVDDIDLFVGSLLETPEKVAAVGPTFACIMAQQFHALKYGDLFFFETDRQPGGFSDEQLQVIREVTFAHVVCLTANITEVPEKVFFVWSKTLQCEELRAKFIDFSLWKKAGEEDEH